MTRFSVLSAFALTTAAAVGQQIFMPPSGTLADPSFSVNIFGQQQIHHQIIYDTSLFASAGIYSPIQINTLEFRQSATAGSNIGFAQTYSSVDFWLQRAATDYLTQSTIYASNRTVAFPTTPNYSGVVTRVLASGATPVNDYVISVTLTTPFIYDPSTGQDLLLEFVVNAVPTPTQVASNQQAIVCTNNIAASKCSTLRVTGPTALTATTGGISVFAPSARLSYTVPPGVAKHDPYGTGCYTYARSFYEQFPGAYPASSNDLSNTTVTLTQNGIGGYNVLTLPGSSLVMPTGTGLALGDDVSSAVIPIPFTFHYPGGNTTAIYAHSNGSVTLNGAATGLFNGADNVGTLLASTVHALSASMQDLLPDGVTNVANVFAEVDPGNPGIFLVTWRNVPCFTGGTPSGLTSTFQIALIDNGTSDSVEFRYLSLVNDSDSYGGAAITGFSTGGTSLDPGNRDLTALIAFNSQTDFGPLTLVGIPRPVMTVPVTYTVSNIRAGGIGLMQCSFGQDLAGTPLSTYGVVAPGCKAHISPAGMASFGPLLFLSPSDGFSFTWPAGFGGVQVFVQAFELEIANPENPAGVISSNGLQVLLGTL